MTSFRPRFTIRHILAGTVLIAAILGGLRWVHQMFQIDPTSERFEINGVQHELDWKSIPWERARTGSSFTPFTASAASSSDKKISLDQKLFQLSYRDYFGNKTFAARVSVYGNHDASWANYFVFPFASGGGNTDGGTNTDFEFDASDQTLRIRLQQWINSKRLAKETELLFKHDGSKFVLQNPSKP